jgi:hypothetical protein
MASLTLVHNEVSFAVPVKAIMSNCNLFDLRPDLYGKPSYEVTSRVNPELFREFVSFLQSQAPIEVSAVNLSGLVELAAEFGVDTLARQCRAFESSSSREERSYSFESEILCRVCALEDRVSRQEHEIQQIIRQFCHFSASQTIMRTELSHFREMTASLSSSQFGKMLKFDPDRPLEGIVHYLTRKAGGNIHERKIVRVSAATSLMGDPENAVDLSSSSKYRSSDKKDGWWCIDFLKIRVSPTHYSVRSHFQKDFFNTHPKSWVLECSNDEKEWIEIDRQENTEILNHPAAIGSFPISRVMKCRMVRFRQLGKNHYGDYRLTFSGFELFGTIFQ